MVKIELLAGERVDQLFSSDVKIIQNREVFSYSIDSVLLSRFPKVPAKKGLIVDMCSGNGAVGLFATSRTKAEIVQIEIQERLADMNRRSILLNGLEDQVRVLEDNLINLPKHIGQSKVDLIFCNPPYFKVDPDSNLNKSEHYLLARHEITTNLDEICLTAQQVLKSNGRLAMVHRPDRFLDILDRLNRYRLVPKRIQFVYPKEGKEANMLLIEAIKDGSPSGLKILPPLFVHQENGEYSPEIQQIYFGKKEEAIKKPAYLYVLKCGDGSLYTGYTTDVKRRVSLHQKGRGAKYTRSHLPVELVYVEEFPDKGSALKAEAQFKKKSRQEKLAYIQAHTDEGGICSSFLQTFLQDNF
ncbi:GIY-YIG nuclease family protein [Streptococcus sp. DD13]|uniref:GIY-YIG nuclease family protein n=1 Tax=Streptococcus sp. DD13 TaxID=1777881 RepID=UPI00079B9A5C|nr:GIY-YIG nuclease family protein [Streptococcus sp. DD13]KXT78333.1 tRNA (adenine37-N(6))-methyltransferase TrmN6 [Streptococcus sp. DD13]